MCVSHNTLVTFYIVLLIYTRRYGHRGRHQV